MARIRSEEEIFGHCFVNLDLNHRWSSFSFHLMNFFLESRYFFQCMSVRLSGNDLRFIVEDRKYIYIFILNLIEKCISMIIARKMARKLFVYHKRKRREVKRIEKHCCELNRKVLFSSRLRKKKKRNNDVAKTTKLLDNRANILCLPFCNLAGWKRGSMA